MLRETLGLMRELPRLQEIAAVLIRHGLGEFVRRLGIAGVLERAGRIVHWSEAKEAERLDPAQRMRRALEELGPTFIKLGQVLATRVDLFPPSWIAEFEKLHADAPAVPFASLLPELERSLGRSPFEVFAEIEERPYAAASIAQVHRARLRDEAGTAVVLKIRRPGVREKIEADLRLLQRLAELVEAEMPEIRRYRPTEIAAQFARSLEREVDFTAEQRNTERFAANFAGHPHVVVPKIYPEYTSDALLVQQHVMGIPATDTTAVGLAGLDRKLLAARGVDVFLKMILIDGFFHADPHPGNVFYLTDNRLVIIDFGMVGRLTPHRRAQVVDLLAGLARMAEEPMLAVLHEWAGDAVLDDERLAADVNDLVFEYEGMPLKDIRIGNVIREFTEIIRAHSIVLPPDLSLMLKTLVTLEGLGRQYDPEIHIVSHITPLVRRALAERYQPSELLRRGGGALREFIESVGTVPRDLARLLREARRGKARVDLDLKRLDSFGRQLDRTIDRATVGILTASLVIGSAIVLTVRDGPQFFGIPVLPALGLAGYLLAFVNSLWIAYGIWRSGRE
jgi:ubiquinone biosynthesis protein